VNERLSALLSFRTRTLRFTSVFLMVCAVSIILIDWQDAASNPMRIVPYSILAATCILSMALVGRFPSIVFPGFVVGIQAVVVVGAWIGGGVRRPASFIEVPLLLLSSFLVGPRTTWFLCVGFVVNTVLVAGFELMGWIPSQSMPETVQVIGLAMSTAFGLYFVGKPLGIARKLLEEAKVSREANLAHQATLARSNEILEARVLERERELTALRNRLSHGTEGLSSSYEPSLQRIAVRARFIEEALKDRDEAQRYPVERILAACDRLTRMHKAISRYSKLGPQGIQARHIDADEVGSTIRSLWDEIRQAYPRAEHRLFLSQLEGCHADPDMLRQVWQHLLSNAAKFSAREHKPLIVVGCKDGEYYVKDNGVGFGADEARNLFEIFGRQHSTDEFPGDGIGLASAKRIIELHGGSIRVVSQPEKGATFFFRLSCAIGATRL
jgi:signal transduction histidine kinase